MIQFVQANLSLAPNFSNVDKQVVRFGQDIFELKETEALPQMLQVITGKELGAALSELGKKTDILIASSCYCQLFETGYYLREQVSILVAAQTSIPISGFNYTSFFNKLRLLEKPVLDNELEKESYIKKLADNVVNKFHKKYTSTYLRHLHALDDDLVYEKDKIALSANDLSQYERIAELLNELGDILLNFHTIQNPDYSSAVGNARRTCLDMDFPDPGKGIIDLTLLVECLQNFFVQLADHRIDAILDTLKEIRKECKVAFLTSDVLSAPPVPPVAGCGECMQKPQFLAVFFPGIGKTKEQSALYRLFLKDPAGVDTIKISLPWNQFIREFVKARVEI